MKRILTLLVVFIMALTNLPATAKVVYDFSEYKDALNQFEACAFSAEYGGDGRDYTVRWIDSLHVYFEGDYTDSDIAFFYRFVSELTRKIDGIPEIRITSDKYDSNVQIYFTPLDRMDDYLSNYTEGNWGYFTYWNMGSYITELEIGIATDVTTQRQRYHLLMEEFVGGLGLANDHYLSDDSILYGVWTETQSLTTADWLMIQFLYDDRIPAGLTWNQIKPLIERYY